MTFKDFQKELWSSLMPSGTELAKKAQEKLTIDKSELPQRFNSYLRKLIDLEFEIYKNYERDSATEIIQKAEKKGLLTSKEALVENFKQNYSQFWGLFLSISQSRKTRAGGSFERHVKYLFQLLDYPFERQQDLDGVVDYLIPSLAAFKKNRTACVVLSAKRTLRERWRQVIGELASTNAGKIYILTADEDISHSKVAEIATHNINLVVWDEYKKKKFADNYNVIGFTDLVNVHLPASKNLWEHLL